MTLNIPASVAIMSEPGNGTVRQYTVFAACGDCGPCGAINHQPWCLVVQTATTWPPPTFGQEALVFLFDHLSTLEVMSTTAAGILETGRTSDIRPRGDHHRDGHTAGSVLIGAFVSQLFYHLLHHACSLRPCGANKQRQLRWFPVQASRRNTLQRRGNSLVNLATNSFKETCGSHP
jgi:hypothetical protein